MLYKLWVHSLQGIHNLQNYMTLAHTYKVSQDITWSILYANNLNCIWCTQWTNYHFQSIAMSYRHSTRIFGVFLYTHPAYILAGKQNKNRGQIVYLLSPLVSFDNTERHRCHIKPTSHNNGTTSSLITKKQENFWYLIAKDSTLSLKSHILYA